MIDPAMAQAFDFRLFRDQLEDLLPSTPSAWIRGAALHAVIWGVFGGLLPWQKGLDFYDPQILTAYACLGCVFAIPLAVKTGQTNRFELVLGRVIGALAYGEFMAVGMLLLGIGVVYATRTRIYFPPAWGDVLEAIVFGAGLTLALVLLGVWCSLRFSPAAAQRILRVVLFGLLVAYFYRGRMLPEAIRPAMAIVFGVAAALMVLLRRAVSTP